MGAEDQYEYEYEYQRQIQVVVFALVLETPMGAGSAPRLGGLWQRRKLSFLADLCVSAFMA